MHGLGVAIHACNCVCSEVYIGNRLGVYVSRITAVDWDVALCSILSEVPNMQQYLSFLLSAFHPSPLSGGPNQWYDWVMGR